MTHFKPYITIIASIALVFLVLMASSHTVQAVKITNIDDAITHIDEIVNEYNNQTNKIPHPITNIFGNEVINITIMKNDNTTINIGMKTKDGKIVAVGEMTDPYTINVQFNEETFNKVLNAKDQALGVKNALHNKEITYQSLRFSTGFKLSIVRTVISIESFFRK